MPMPMNNKNKINILITHGSIDASSEVDAVYNPIKKYKIKIRLSQIRIP